MIVVDTGAIVALVDADDKHHEAVKELFEDDPGAWLVPWAVLPEVDYLLATHVGRKAQDAFLADLAQGAFAVEWGQSQDLVRAETIHRKYRALRLGLVDGIVIAIAERVRARAIATLDLRHFGAVSIRGRPKLLPRDGCHPNIRGSK
ncbi:MAG: type II toxin-antitoxin system VapC family toxin [Polyangiaceae bacterium]